MNTGAWMRFSYFKFLMILTCLTFATNSFGKRFDVPPLEESFYTWGQTSEDALDSQNIHVVVWNILKSKKRKFYKEFTSFGKKTDLFLLQEVSTVDNFFDALSYYDGHNIHFGASFAYKKWGKSLLSGTAIASRIPASDAGMLRTKDLEPFVKTPKVVTYVRVPIKDSESDLLVLNIHGLNMTKNSAFKRQLDECESMIASHEGPVIFAGDFNTSDMEKYNDMIALAQRMKLVPVAFLNDKRKKSRFSRLIIDHVFIRGLDVTSAQVLDDYKASDHKAMEMVLKTP